MPIMTRPDSARPEDLPIGWPPPHDPSGAPAPLHGVRVLDLSRVLAGPLACMQLGDLGATVLKVESPTGGDLTRTWPPFLDDGTSTYYSAMNRNKRSVALDLDTDEGRDAAVRLAVGADVVVDNFLPGRLARFGLAPDVLRRDRPDLVTATVTGYPSDGESAHRPGFDFLAQAAGGVMAITGEAGGAPLRMGVAVVDLVAGMQLTQGILAALVERNRTGAGRSVEVALMDCAAFTLMNLGSTHLMTGADIPRFGNQHPSIAPYETLPVSDGEIAVAVGSDRQFARFADGLGLRGLADDPRFATNAARVENRGELRAVLDERLRTATRAEWLERLLALDLPVAPVNEVADVFADPQTRAHVVEEIDGVPQVRGPVRIDGRALPMHLRPPTLGEHTDEVLGRLAAQEW